MPKKREAVSEESFEKPKDIDQEGEEQYDEEITEQVFLLISELE
ncbi:10327_t:CDS:1, partial [Acaulospora morrowiae]